MAELIRQFVSSQIGRLRKEEKVRAAKCSNDRQCQHKGYTHGEASVQNLRSDELLNILGNWLEPLHRLSNTDRAFFLPSGAVAGPVQKGLVKELGW